MGLCCSSDALLCRYMQLLASRPEDADGDVTVTALPSQTYAPLAKGTPTQTVPLILQQQGCQVRSNNERPAESEQAACGDLLGTWPKQPAFTHMSDLGWESSARVLRPAPLPVSMDAECPGKCKCTLSRTGSRPACTLAAVSDRFGYRAAACLQQVRSCTHAVIAEIQADLAAAKQVGKAAQGPGSTILTISHPFTASQQQARCAVRRL